jgi:hypothetical protein
VSFFAHLKYVKKLSVVDNFTWVVCQRLGATVPYSRTSVDRKEFFKTLLASITLYFYMFIFAFGIGILRLNSLNG